MRIQKKQQLRQLRQWRIRKKVKGTAERPRMAVRFSNENIYVQFIDDTKGVTLASACTTSKAINGEKVSGLSYKEYMRQNIFEPLGMTSTYAFDITDAAPKCNSTSCYLNKWSEWNLNFSDGVLGDKGIYSSVEDMLKWDIALKEGKIVSYDMQQLAYTPQSLDRYSFRDRSRNYGYGWRLMMQPDRSYVVYHNGNWHGCNNVFTRDLTNGYTIIVLSNKANERNYQTGAIWDMIGQMKNAQNVAGIDQPSQPQQQP